MIRHRDHRHQKSKNKGHETHWFDGNGYEPGCFLCFPQFPLLYLLSSNSTCKSAGASISAQFKQGNVWTESCNTKASLRTAPNFLQPAHPASLCSTRNAHAQLFKAVQVNAVQTKNLGVLLQLSVQPLFCQSYKGSPHAEFSASQVAGWTHKESGWAHFFISASSLSLSARKRSRACSPASTSNFCCLVKASSFLR